MSATAKQWLQSFVDQMEGFALELEDELMNFSDVSYKSFVKSESEIITLFYDKFADIPLLSRMDAVAETFIDEIETLLNRDLPEEERIPLIEKFQKMYETMDFYVLYNRFLKKEGYQTLPRRPLEKRKLRYEDVYPVLYLKYRLSRQAERSNIKHLVIDEMQDYSRLQYLIIRRMFSCKMTILGDRAQTMADQQQDVLQFLPGIFAHPRAHGRDDQQGHPRQPSAPAGARPRPERRGDRGGDEHARRQGARHPQDRAGAGLSFLEVRSRTVVYFHGLLMSSQ